MKKFEKFDGKDDLQLIRERKLGEVEEYVTIKAKEFHDLKALMFIYRQLYQIYRRQHVSSSYNYKLLRGGSLDFE